MSSFVVYVDESGDEGFVFNPDGKGSSHWFVLAAAITRRESDLETVKLADEVRQLLHHKPRAALHFRKLKHEHRIPYVQRIAAARLRLVAVLVHKPSLKEPETFQQRYVLYRYATRLLLERVSWFCRDHRTANDAGDGSAEVIFSNRAGMSYDELRDYMVKLKAKTLMDDIRIDWSVIQPDAVRAMSHERMMGLQIADAVASSFYFGVQKSPYGFTEPRYAQMLKPIVYHRQRQYMGYGIKLWPREAQDMPDKVEELKWIRGIYG